MNKLDIKNNQTGLVSFTITVIVMVIVALIVSSFALIVRKEQRRSLDRQLSAQAFYAAETGIDMAARYIDATKQAPVALNSIDECSGPDGFIEQARNYKFTNSVGTDDYPFAAITNQIQDNIEFSCVLINRTPNDLEITELSAGQSKLIPINSASGANIARINISWQAKENLSNADYASTNFELPIAGLKAPLIKSVLMPGLNSSTTGSEIDAAAQTNYLYPSTGGLNSVNYLGSTPPIDQTNVLQGGFVSGNCNAANDLDCSINITNLSAQSFYLYLLPLYADPLIRITAYDSGNNQLEISGSQAIIDATGRAADVTRRIRVRKPIDGGLNTTNIIPKGALVTAEKICKLLERDNVYLYNKCTNQDTLLSSTGNGGGTGDAGIGGCNNPNPPPGCSNGTYDPNAPDFQWDVSLMNDSTNPQGSVLNCTWEWGDGTSNTYAATDPPCISGRWVNHNYNPPTDSRGWQALIINTNGQQGCWFFTVKLTMNFTPESGLGPNEDISRIEVPIGKANDPDNPITGRGICSGKFVNYP